VLSSAIMVALGRVHRGRMVAMRSTNAKLHRRAAGMVAELAGVEEGAAQAALAASGHDISIAVLVAGGLSPGEAREALARNGGALAAALAELGA
jgi:N-acetylmuramic acid 6-phosphate etherase